MVIGKRGDLHWWHTTQGIFPHHTHRSQDRLQVRDDPDQNKSAFKDERMNDL